MARQARRSVASTAVTRTFEPQLALLVKTAPTGDAWLHELKYDGYRIGCSVEDGQVVLLSRSGKDWTDAFPEVVAAARKLLGQRAGLLDGEVTIVDSEGKTSFQALQNVFGGGERRGLTYFAFDLLHLEGQDVAGLPLDQRKAALRKLIRGNAGLIRYSDHVIGGGPAFLAEACRLGLEGIVSKQRELPYRSGRGPGWVKTKCVRRQEFVVGGFTDPEGSREGIGALLIGVRDAQGKLVFAGKVGTGFTRKSAQQLRKRLDDLATKTCPFTPRPVGFPGAARAHWVQPVLVAEVAFAEWTGDGKVRHPSFQGLRQDKAATDVVVEREVAAPSVPAAAGNTGETAEVAGIRISNGDRVLYPESGVTKLDLARYYQTVADAILPHLADRPLTLVRCPKGIGADGKSGCFFMKHSGAWAPKELRRVQIREKAKSGTYLVAEDLKGLILLAQMNVLELHTWNSCIADLERPDRVIFDLDPGPQVPWSQVIDGARLVRQSLASVGLDSFVKTTGGKGLHVVVPLVPERSWDECLAFSRDLSTAVARAHADRYTIAIPKAGREAKILIDYLRNNRGSTAVVALSTRARPNAPVGVPLGWDELSPELRSDHFTTRTVPDRLRTLRQDPWRAFFTCRQRLTTALLRAVANLV